MLGGEALGPLNPVDPSKFDPFDSKDETPNTVSDAEVGDGGVAGLESGTPNVFPLFLVGG